MRYLINIILLIAAPAFSQRVDIISTSANSSLRGLSVVNDKILWVSGNGGTIGRSLDGGSTWKWFIVKDFQKADFRDIEAFDAVTSIIMGISSPGYILKTVDGGDSWKVVYENKMKGIFMDAMEFWNERSGIIIGDPIGNKFFILRTFDGGNTWQDIPSKNYPRADSGEACFASSGTNIRHLTKKEACFVSGGLRSRLFIRDEKYDIPVLQGKESTGANSIAIKNKNTFIVVGGDFTVPTGMEKNCAITHNGGKTWTLPSSPPHGYRSCVEFIEKKTWISCGLNGVDYSDDDGNTWRLISNESFNVCQKAKDGKSVFFAGNKGKIGKLVR